ncbi:hypothetical protein HDU80_007771 [Chytriomyces hyalinus]|nr:hypothetical protein HDU80_007771 [Chytriomyces hyalinus]
MSSLHTDRNGIVPASLPTPPAALPLALSPRTRSPRKSSSMHQLGTPSNTPMRTSLMNFLDSIEYNHVSAGGSKRQTVSTPAASPPTAKHASQIIQHSLTERTTHEKSVKTLADAAMSKKHTLDEEECSNGSIPADNQNKMEEVSREGTTVVLRFGQVSVGTVPSSDDTPELCQESDEPVARESLESDSMNEFATYMESTLSVLQVSAPAIEFGARYDSVLRIGDKLGQRDITFTKRSSSLLRIPKRHSSLNIMELRLGNE